MQNVKFRWALANSAADANHSKLFQSGMKKNAIENKNF